MNRAVQGKDIGTVHSGTGEIIALRPVEVYSEDFALIEYGLTEDEMKRAARRIKQIAKNEKPRAGTERPEAFAVEFGNSWKRWVERG